MGRRPWWAGAHRLAGPPEGLNINNREIHMLGLTSLGVVHTAISLVAVATGLAALVAWREIPPRSRLGQVYVWTTALTCLTGFGIFQHGGFGAPHALGILTLLVLGLALLAGRTALFGRAARYVETLGMSTTFFFHMVPGFTETFTRLPAGAPLFTGPDDPGLQKVLAVCFVVYLVGVGLQVWRLRGQRPAGPTVRVA
jgi:hypothetical protein